MKVKSEKLPKDAKERWISETQMFQRIAGTPLTSEAELAEEWDQMKTKSKKFHLRSIETHRMIQDAAIEAGKKRQN